MHIGFVPFCTTSFNDILWIEETMRRLLKRLRLTAPAAPSEPATCDMCGTFAFGELHHARPLWSVATEAILREHPTTIQDIGRIERMAYEPAPLAWMLRAHKEMIPLCRSCHSIATKASNREWKARLSERYPLLWSYLIQREEIISLSQKWYA